MPIAGSQRWTDFVYRLVYPGILGSMIFDIADPLRSWSIAKSSPLFIFFAFAIDYWHMHGNLEADDKSKGSPILDLVIALCFSFAYFILARTTKIGADVDAALFPLYCKLGLAVLAAAYVVIFVYEIDGKPFLAMDAMRLVPSVMSGIGIVVLLFSASDPVSVAAAATLASTFFYWLYVYKYPQQAGE